MLSLDKCCAIHAGHKSGICPEMNIHGENMEEGKKAPSTLKMFNRPDVAGAVLQKTSQHHYTQTVRAREVKFLENVHPPPCTKFKLVCN